MINPDSVGRTFKGAESITITQSQIDAFAAAIGESERSVAPPTFSIRITLPEFESILTQPDIGVDWRRVVHGDQSFEIYRPIVAGDIFTCSATIESLRVVSGNEIISVRNDLHNRSELVVSSWATLVVRG
ncbi:MAG: MaoC family dehydratase N-terminal domain-containing protein [Actinomycetota bacterium]|nr:MaoC family dehydratase N-terminal domain-containing protein [Actinomycetota bacterium]